MPKVAFSAHLANTAEKSISKGDTVIFDNIVTNEGNAFNQVKGSFTAPYKGLYFFTINFMTSANHVSLLGIYLNDNRLCTAYAHTVHDVASCSIITHLQVGDVLSIKAGMDCVLWRNDWAHRNHHGFTGFLYKPL